MVAPIAIAILKITNRSEGGSKWAIRATIIQSAIANTQIADSPKSMTTKTYKIIREAVRQRSEEFLNRKSTM